MTFPFIAIVSGTRETNTPQLAEAVRYQLSQLPLDAMVVHGACRLRGAHELSGADAFADRIARELGFPIKKFPVLDSEWKTIGLSAGPKRSFRMIDWAIANSIQCVLLAFPIKGGKGTYRATAYAELKGVPVRRWFE